MVRIDDTDRELIAVLQRDGRRPYSRLATDVGVSEHVVRYRVQRLERAGILQIVGVTDPLKIGFDLMAMVGVRVTPGRLREVVDAITQVPETSYVASLAGSFDVIVELICRDTAHFTETLTERLQTIDGIQQTESFLLLEIHKLSYGWGTGQHPAPADRSR